MVEKSNNYGTEEYKGNTVDESDYYGNADAFVANLCQGKAKRGGVGGKGSKSNNFKEQKNANKRRFEKNEREATREEERAKQQWIEEQNAYYAPVDKKDAARNKKLQQQNDQMLAKMKKKQDKADRDMME